MDLWLDAWKMAWETIRLHRLRSALTALTFALGAGAVVLMLSLAQSAVDTIYSGLDAVGGRELVFIFPKQPDKAVTSSGIPRLTMDDARALRERLPGKWTVSMLFRQRRVLAQAGSKKMELDLAGGRTYMRLLLMRIVKGRYPLAGTPHQPPPREIALAEKAARQLFGSSSRALHQTLLIRGHRYRVVGIAGDRKKLGFNMGSMDKHRAGFVASRTLPEIEGMQNSGLLVLRDLAGEEHGWPLTVARAVLRRRHGGVVDFEVFDFQKNIKGIDSVFLGLKVVTALISALSLIIAGAGVMNVLLASVRERVGEIGIRRALGASGRDIRRQFLVESSLIALLGGAVGAAAGLALTWIGGWVAAKAVPGWVSSVSWISVLLGVGASVLVGILFGLRPASKAAKLEIVACLRGELS